MYMDKEPSGKIWLHTSKVGRWCSNSPGTRSIRSAFGHQRFFEIGSVILEMMPVDKVDLGHDDSDNNDQIDSEMKTLSIRSHAHAQRDALSSSFLRCVKFYIDRNRLDHGVELDDVTLSDKGKTFEFVILQELPRRGADSDEEWTRRIITRQEITHNAFNAILKPTTDMREGVKAFDSMIDSDMERLEDSPSIRHYREVTGKELQPHTPDIKAFEFDISSLKSYPSEQQMETNDGYTYRLKIFTELLDRRRMSDSEWKNGLEYRQNVTNEAFDLIRNPSPAIKDQIKIFNALVDSASAQIGRAESTSPLDHVLLEFDISSLNTIPLKPCERS